MKHDKIERKFGMNQRQTRWVHREEYK
jgi:hypothetical protein